MLVGLFQSSSLVIIINEIKYNEDNVSLAQWFINVCNGSRAIASSFICKVAQAKLWHCAQLIRKRDWKKCDMELNERTHCCISYECHYIPQDTNGSVGIIVYTNPLQCPRQLESNR